MTAGDVFALALIALAALGLAVSIWAEHRRRGR